VSFNGGASDDTTTRDEPGVLYCANHPNVPTVPRCSRCGKPICARCRVATPVGYRCYDCADVRVVPTYAVDTSYYFKSAGVGLGAAAVLGVLWGLLPGFDFWAAMIMGLVVGEGVSWAANMKRGPGLQMVGLLSVAAGVVISRVVLLGLVVRNEALFSALSGIPGNGQALLQALGRLGGGGGLGGINLFGFDLVGVAFVALALGLVYYRLR
jgi:hypothetical protein